VLQKSICEAYTQRAAEKNEEVWMKITNGCFDHVTKKLTVHFFEEKDYWDTTNVVREHAHDQKHKHTHKREY